MIIKKSFILFIFISFAIFSGVSCSPQVSLQLKRFPNGQLYIPLQSAYEKFEVQFLPTIEGTCSNTVQVGYKFNFPISYYGKSSYSQFSKYGGEYGGVFNLENSTVSLNFTITDDVSSITSQLCFIRSSYYLDKTDNLIDSLYSQNLIEEKKFFISTNNNIAQYSNYLNSVGKIDVGSPNYNLIKKGQSLINLKTFNGQSDAGFGYYATTNGSFSFGNVEITAPKSLGFNFNNEYILLTTNSLNSLLEEFKHQGIKYYYQEYQGNLWVHSIEKLSDISINAVAEDGSIFKIKLTPQQYTKLQDDGVYKVLIYSTPYNVPLTLSYQAFLNYYVGFDFTNGQISIAEKSPEKLSQI